MPLPKPLSKAQILAAMAKTRSNRASARYLHVSYQHYKRWAKLYKDEESGKSLFEIHLNPSGKGIPKFLKGSKKEPALLDIIEGRVSAAHFQPAKLKYRLIEEGYLSEECSMCGFKERRVLDYKMPLLLHFKDGNNSNYSQENVELLCYNHYFLLVGNIFNEKDIKHIESYQEHMGTSENIEWEIDEYHLQRLKELGLENMEEDDVNQYISRI
jgi:hypothetical protein